MTNFSPALLDILEPEAVDWMTGSWLAYSAANICLSTDGRLLVGWREEVVPNIAIPEKGDGALIGGFNASGKGPVVQSPAMFVRLAHAHAKNQLGIDLQTGQCSPFLHCEYDMNDIDEPLVTPFGKIDLKRVAFDRIVHLTADQVKQIEQNGVPGGKIKSVTFVNNVEFEQLLVDGRISFPHEVDHIRQAFTLFPKLPTKTGWIV